VAVTVIGYYIRFEYTFLQVNWPKGPGRNSGALQINLGAVAYRAMWGYGVGPPSDTNDHVLTCGYAVGRVLPVRVSPGQGHEGLCRVQITGR
jgi:hypothetical protein